MKKTLQSLALGLALLAGARSATASEILFSDNFSNDSVNPPTFAKPGVQWVIDKGKFGADGTAVDGNYKPVPGQLNFGKEPGTKIHIDLAAPGSKPNQLTALEFSLRNSDEAKANYLFTVRLEDTTEEGVYYDLRMSPNPGYFEKTGIALYWHLKNDEQPENRFKLGTEAAAIGQRAGAPDMVRIEFDPSGGVTLQVNGEEVLNAPNSLGLEKINRISLINESGEISYFVDDVIVEGTAP